MNLDQSLDARFSVLHDGRKLCLECLDSAIMNTGECQPLFHDVLEFFKGLSLKLTQQIPLLLVDEQAINQDMTGERVGGHHHTRGVCLSTSRMNTEPDKSPPNCEVTAILVLYGLPRLLTGTILAFTTMCAWLRLNGYMTSKQGVEEGICTVIAGMWLDSQIPLISDSNNASTSQSHGSTTSTNPSRSRYEKKLGEFFKHQMASDTSVVYGNGFRAGHQAVIKFGLWRTLDHIKKTGEFPL